MLNRREIMVAGAASMFAQGAGAQSVAVTGPILTPEQIKSDLALLQDIYQTLHPGLYRYNSKAQIEVRFQQVARNVTAPKSLAQVYLDFSSLLASVRCGHSYANFYSQSDEVKTALFEGKNRLPFTFDWIDRQMVILNPAKIDGLVAGSIITHINGLSTRRILESLINYVRADGNNVGKQISLLSVKRDEGFQTFDIFYALHYGSKDTFILRGRSPAGQSFTKEVAAIDRPARLAMTASPSMETGQPLWSLDIDPNVSAVLTMPNWGLYQSNWDWKAWLAASFVRINEAAPHSLIIDLRGNEGGNDDIGPELLSYLSPNPVLPLEGQRRTAYKTIPARLNPLLETWDDRFRDLGEQAVLRLDGMYDLVDTQGRSGGGAAPKGVLTKPMSKMILTDAANSSATLQFCQMAVANRIAGTFGETTGGNLRGINAEKFMFARLPATGLEVDVPLVGFFSGGNQPNGGLRPTYPIARTATAIGENTDIVKSTALAVGANIDRLLNK
jgi:Peptidase family S41